MTTENGVIAVPLDSIAPSKTNPRKHFEPGALKELADNIREIGILQPLLVRALLDQTKGKEYELVFGERRWRAARTAGLENVPVIIRPLDDKQVLELQVVENLQREDLTALEEAEGYDRLIRQHGYTVEALAAKIGKSKSHVYARRKLLDLCTQARAALSSGKIAAEIALLIARIPDPKLQAEALKEIQQGDWNGPMSYREAKEFIQRDYMLRLSDAPFDVKDGDLLKSAGACAACPKRTGNQAELFQDVGRADLCTDPKCFAQKKEAWNARELDRAREAGQEVHGPKEAKKFFQHGSVKSGFVDLSDRCDQLGYDHDKHWQATLGKDCPTPILAVDESGEVHKLVPAADAKAALKKKGLKPRSESRASDDWHVQERRRSATKKRLRAVASDAVTLMLPRLVKQLRDSEESLWRRIATRIDQQNDIDVATFIARRRGLAETQTQSRSQLDKWLKAPHTVEELQEFVIESLLGSQCLSGWDKPVLSAEFKDLCHLGGVDLTKLEKQRESGTAPKSKGKAKSKRRAKK